VTAARESASLDELRRGASVRHFASIVAKSQCPFARRSHIVGGPAHGAETLAEVVEVEQPRLHWLAKIGARHVLDAYVVELAAASWGSTIEELRNTTWSFLSLLHIAEHGVPLLASELEREDWWLLLGGERHFVLSFAPCYPIESPRHTFVSESTFFVFQPVHAFERAAEDGVAIPTCVRHKVREAFQHRGRAYSGALADDPREATKLVWPLPGEPGPECFWRGNDR
jgi:hypothetical protein